MDSSQVQSSIVFVDDAHTFGGAQIALGWAIRAILRRCHNARVVCLCTPATHDAIQQITGAHKNLRFVECPQALPLNVFTFPLRVWPFYRLLKVLFREGVHTWWFNLSGIEFCLAPSLVLRLFGFRPVAWLHNTETCLFFNTNSSRSRRLLSQVRDIVANKFCFGIYGWVITPSRATEVALKNRIRCSHPLRTGFLYPITGIMQERQHITVDQTSRPCLDLWMVGRVQYVHKNNLLGLRILKRLLCQQKAARLTVVGNGPDMEHFRRTTSDLKLDDFVSFVGWEKNPWKSISENAIVVIPSFYEGMPLVATEAMLHGARIVASPIPAFVEGIPNELIARDFSVEAFLERIEEVSAMSHEHLLRLYSPALEKFTEQAFVAKFLSILQTSSNEA